MNIVAPPTVAKEPIFHGVAPTNMEINDPMNDAPTEALTDDVDVVQEPEDASLEDTS